MSYRFAQINLKLRCWRFLAVAISVYIIPVLGIAQPSEESALNLLINGQADAAARALKASLNANPSDAQQHNLLCRVQYAEERWDVAVSECERAANLDPKNATYQLWLGRAYGEKAEHSSWLTAIGLAKKTRIAFEKAVQLDPQNVEAHSDLSEYYIEAPGFLGGGTDKAAAQANMVEKIEPATAHWIRARIAEHQSKNNDAEAEYKRALALETNSPRRLFDLASFYRRVNRLNELETTIQKSVQLNTKNDSTLADSAALLLRVGRNLPLAATLLRRYIDQGEKSEDAPVFQAQHLLGQILEKTGDVQGAKLAYLAARSAASDFAPPNAALKRLGA